MSDDQGMRYWAEVGQFEQEQAEHKEQEHEHINDDTWRVWVREIGKYAEPGPGTYPADSNRKETTPIPF